jgi:hypothetical protein
MIPRPVFLVAAAAVLFLTGCTTARTPAQRIDRDRAVFDAWPGEVQRLVEAGQVAVGLSEAQVRMALGDPDDVSTRTTAEGQTVVWTYRDRKPRVGLGFGVSGGSGGSGVGLGVGTSTGGTQAPRLRVLFAEGFVTAVEEARR